MTRTFWKGARAGVYVIFLLAGGVFWIASHTGGFAMSAQVYGADVIAVPAEVWAAMLFLPAVAYLVALYINGRWWGSVLVRLVSGLIIAIKFSAFVVSSSAAPFGDIVMIWGVVLGGATVALACVDGVDLSRQIKGRHNDTA